MFFIFVLIYECFIAETELSSYTWSWSLTLKCSHFSNICTMTLRQGANRMRSSAKPAAPTNIPLQQVINLDCKENLGDKTEPWRVP